eukprot:15366091-Ditylum_brightwellii.AAC.1
MYLCREYEDYLKKSDSETASYWAVGHYSSGFILCKEVLPTVGSVKYKDNAKERPSNLSRLYGVRPDYMSSIFGWLLENYGKKYPVRNCVVFDYKFGPIVLTCKNYDGGNSSVRVHPPMNPATGTFPSLHGDQLAPTVMCQRKVQNDEGNEYMCAENVAVCENGATYVSFKDAIKLCKKMRSVHECTSMVVVEDVVERSYFWGMRMNRKKRDTEHNNEDKDVCNDDLKSVLEDVWENEGIFMTFREQIDADGELWDDDESMNSEELSNVGDGRSRRVVKKFKPTWSSAIIRVQCINDGYGMIPPHVLNMELLGFNHDAS